MVLAATAATLVIAACGKSDSPSQPAGPSPADSPAGSFSLTTINAKPLPYMMYSDTNYTVEVSAGSFLLQTSAKFIATITSRETVLGHVSVYVDSASGTWAHPVATPTSVVFTGIDGSTQTATCDGKKLTLAVVDGMITTTYVCTKVP